MSVNVNDKVILKSTTQEALWTVIDINPHNPAYVTIQCLTNRLIKVTPKDQVEKVDEITAKEIFEKCEATQEVFIAAISKNIHSNQSNVTNEDNGLSKIPGIVLHLDSDAKFLQKCLDYYKEKNVKAHGYSMKPIEMPGRISELLNTFNPDILVITGHDGFIRKEEPYSLESYIYSKYYVDTVKQARKFDRNKDSLVIFAGACESFYDALMSAGANFASSPKRVSIHTYDPAIIATEVALTPILSRVSPGEVVIKAESTFNEIGGIDTRGALRNGIPFSMDSKNRNSSFENKYRSKNYTDETPLLPYHNTYFKCPYMYFMSKNQSNYHKQNYICTPHGIIRR